ncbi:hypothetical protein ABTY98_05010 [Streptomyces sp. NPDC096040]|uniref:hypothetical protein n=1 Tax=Streptomyces sp. NPDC096040 TaxID=3155541 RepID=UPI003330CEE0
MTPEMVFAALVALVLLVPAAYAAYRAAHTPPGDSGECPGEDCRQCAVLFGHPSQAAARQAIAEGIKPQTRKGW